MPRGEQIMNVLLRGRLAGTLKPHGHGRRLHFVYDDEYLGEADPPPLSTSLPLRPEPYAPAKAEPWFDGLLPEDLRRERLAHLVGTATTDTWTLLAAAGGECAGAVQIVPEGHEDAPDLIPIDDAQIARLLARPAAPPIQTIERGARISLAGAQDKIALRRLDDHWYVPIFGAISTHILKATDPRFIGLIDNEHACLEIARRSGVAAPNATIENFDGQRVLVIERYDRTTGSDESLQRVHQETLAQALSVRTEHKYAPNGEWNTADLFAAMPQDCGRLFEHIMTAWLLGDCDRHAMNYAILDPGTSDARLAPIYDLISTETYSKLTRKLGTPIGDATDLRSVTANDIKQLGTLAGYEGADALERVHNLAERTRDAIDATRDEGISLAPITADRIGTRADLVRDWAGA